MYVCGLVSQTEVAELQAKLTALEGVTYLAEDDPRVQQPPPLLGAAAWAQRPLTHLWLVRVCTAYTR